MSDRGDDRHQEIQTRVLGVEADPGVDDCFNAERNLHKSSQVQTLEILPRSHFSEMLIAEGEALPSRI